MAGQQQQADNENIKFKAPSSSFRGLKWIKVLVPKFGGIEIMSSIFKLGFTNLNLIETRQVTTELYLKRQSKNKIFLDVGNRMRMIYK